MSLKTQQPDEYGKPELHGELLVPYNPQLKLVSPLTPLPHRLHRCSVVMYDILLTAFRNCHFSLLW